VARQARMRSAQLDERIRPWASIHQLQAPAPRTVPLASKATTTRLDHGPQGLQNCPVHWSANRSTTEIHPQQGPERSSRADRSSRPATGPDPSSAPAIRPWRRNHPQQDIDQKKGHSEKRLDRRARKCRWAAVLIDRAPVNWWPPGAGFAGARTARVLGPGVLASQSSLRQARRNSLRGIPGQHGPVSGS